MASSDGSGLDDWSGKVAVACEELKNVKDLWVFGYVAAQAFTDVLQAGKAENQKVFSWFSLLWMDFVVF